MRINFINEAINVTQRLYNYDHKLIINLMTN